MGRKHGQTTWDSSAALHTYNNIGRQIMSASIEGTHSISVDRDSNPLPVAGCHAPVLFVVKRECNPAACVLVRDWRHNVFERCMLYTVRISERGYRIGRRL